MSTTTAIPTDLEAFDKFLSNHDWHYDFSDSHQVYLRGKAAEDRLIAFVNAASDEHKRLFNKHHARVYNRPPFVHVGGYKFPCPEVEMPPPSPKLLARGSATPDHQTAQYFYMALQRAGILDQISDQDLLCWVERAEVYDTPGGRLIFETFQLSHPFVAHDINSKN